MQEFSMEGGYKKNPKKPQNCQNWCVGACPGQYSIVVCFLLVSHLTQTLGRCTLHKFDHNQQLRAQEHSVQRKKHKMCLCREFDRNVV